MHHQPDHPSDEAAELEWSNLRDPRVASNGGHDSPIVILELGHIPALGHGEDVAPHQACLLDGHLGQHRQIVQAGEVADHHHLRMSRQLQRPADGNPPAPVWFDPKLGP